MNSGLDSQAFFALQPVDQLPVHDPSLPAKKNPQPHVTVVHLAGSQVSKSNAICSSVYYFLPIQNPPFLVMPKSKT
jgi:hypothetical protein